ncbi:hypothetical protein NQ314_020216 [Rhamnusium bicolor]|uniref:ZP domain-containing protein n=1 Tax=Rhamnusium bicolor TaxID=1586634 RepID=A0AAV8WM44_9CUCU|nr:hypothetical protein NQ314_020216 [Rhamnusium bicolor]
MSQYLILAVCICLWTSAASQSNYADQANNIEYQGEGLPEQATLDGKVTKLDDLSPVIFLNRTKAALNCAAGSMQIELKFNEKFYGIAYADFDRNSACQVYGKGGYSYKLELPLKGCGTKQGPQRVFTNNIVVRFHPGLEIDGDEIITIVCRYPPPVAPTPASVFKHFLAPTASPVGPPLKGFQILLIICGILFLSLLLLGLGCSYYCLRRRPVTVIRHPFSSIGTDSEITQLSPSSLGNLSMSDGVKIPRANVPRLMREGSSSGSEGHNVSDTLPSDYPSESHSETEDVDRRSLPVSSAGSYENTAYVPDNSSFYSDGYGPMQEQYVQNAVATPATVPRLPLAFKDQPTFDVQVRVKKQPPSPPSISMSDTESSRTDRNLSTILEQREESVRSIDSPPPVERTQFTYIPELHPPPKHVQPAPTYNRILRRQLEMQEEPMRVAPARSIASLNTEMTDTHSMTEMIDDSHHKFVAPTPPPPPPIIPRQEYIMDMEEPVSLEPPIAAVHKPEITSHVVDDVFLRTITEKKTIEDIERHKRLITEYHTRPKPIEDQKWDVTIKNYPVEMPEPPDWENFSDISSASGLTLTPKPERATMSLPPKSTIVDDKLPLNAPEIVANLGQQPPRHIVSLSIPPRDENFLSTFNIPLENPEVPNWNVLIRVLQPTEHDEGLVIENAETFNSQLTMTDKMKWRQIITTESTLRTLLTECVVREDFERIRQDTRYEKIFEPPKWDVIIRILTPLDKQPKSRFRKRNDWDTRSRRSSLPTLYEYDSDGGSSVRTLTHEPMVHPLIPQRSRKNSRSSYRSEADLRSMSEMIVDFGRPDNDRYSEASSYYPDKRYYDDSEPGHPSLARSLSQPSLARSASEFTERWIAPSRYDTASEFTSPEGTPKSQRSTRIQPLHLPRGTEERSSMWQASQASRTMQGPGTTTQVVSQEYRSQATSNFMGTAPPKNWFGDNDSEASFK